jgi:DNA-directed RNA polymerase specialized sigma24 family protein
MTLRARSRRRVREIPISRIDLTGQGPVVAQAAADMDAHLLDDALHRLPVEQRAILVFDHLDGRGLVEIAAILQIPVGTAKSRLFAARRALAAALAAVDEGPKR